MHALPTSTPVRCALLYGTTLRNVKKDPTNKSNEKKEVVAIMGDDVNPIVDGSGIGEGGTLSECVSEMKYENGNGNGNGNVNGNGRGPQQGGEAGYTPNNGTSTPTFNLNEGNSEGDEDGDANGNQAEDDGVPENEGF